MSAQAARDDPATGPAGDEVIEPEKKALAWESETGVEQSGRWRLEPLGDGEATRVHLEISFRLQGPGSRLAERLMARVVDRNMEATLLAVRRMVEFDERIGARS